MNHDFVNVDWLTGFPADVREELLTAIFVDNNGEYRVSCADEDGKEADFCSLQNFVELLGGRPLYGVPCQCGNGVVESGPYNQVGDSAGHAKGKRGARNSTSSCEGIAKKVWDGRLERVKVDGAVDGGVATVISSVFEKIRPYVWFRDRTENGLQALCLRALLVADEVGVPPDVFVAHGAETVAYAYRYLRDEVQAQSILPLVQEVKSALRHVSGYVPGGNYGPSLWQRAKKWFFSSLVNSDLEFIQRWGTELYAAHLPQQVVKLSPA
jgi:hypothetical protein